METSRGTENGAEMNDDRADAASSADAAPPSGSWLVRNLPYLLCFAAALAFVYYKLELQGTITIVKVLVGLGLVIFVHELGHFLVAKACDVHVETFSIGFGPALPGCSFRRGETTYMIGLFPLGGYVKMVGEGAESDENEDDPRSFKNKPVWQRMAIISAGVTMNLILAVACFVFVFQTRGDEQAPGVIDAIDSGSPAWKVGARTGAIIRYIGLEGPDPLFDAVRQEIMNSQANEKLRFVFGPPNASDEEMTRTEIQPERLPGELVPIIGFSPPYKLKLMPAPWASKPRIYPFFPGGPCATASPPFDWEDVIVATTDPNNPGKIKELPPDPRNPANRDYFEFLRRIERLEGKTIIVQVRRGRNPEPVSITIQPGYHKTFGARMRIGKIVAIRADSPAERGGVQNGDIIDGVEVRGANGSVVSFSTSPNKSAQPAKKPLDPVKLPFLLKEVAGANPGDMTVTLTLLRENPPGSNSHEKQKYVNVRVTWDRSWDYNKEIPLKPYSPLSIPQLGLAYRVLTTVEAVDPDSPAASVRVEKGAGSIQEGSTIPLQNGDVIKEVTAEISGARDGEKPQLGKWTSLEPDQWANVFSEFQFAESKRIYFKLERENLEVSVELGPDRAWPLHELGLRLEPDTRLKKAANIGEALGMGLTKTLNFIKQIFGNLRGLSAGRISPGAFAGPVGIARIAYEIAGRNMYEFILFLGLICVNLAVVNFLPIPVLDGGHMVFLVYEKLRGKPAPEGVRLAATYVGLALIVSLMATFLYVDIWFRR